MSAFAWRDGVVVDASAVVVDGADGVFETLGLSPRGSALPLWERHLARLRAGARSLRLPWRLPSHLQRAAFALLRRNGHDVLRLALLRGRRGPHWVMTTRGRSADREPLPVVLAPSARMKSAYDAVKLNRRQALATARAHARTAGAHDALLWREDRVLEATAYNLFVRRGARLVTPRADGALLPGLARALLLRAGLASEAEVTLVELAGLPLVLTNAVYGPRLAYLVDGGAGDVGPSPAWFRPLRAAWDAAVGP
jgi:branched-subunit amino acid aminotransferase/4-amino-4-deoxychorismate lyase